MMMMMKEKNIKDVDFKKVKLQDCLKGDLEILPLRTLDDFILTSAKFQIPEYKDARRWWNRVYNNLFYYQTNYILSGIIIFIYFLFMYTTKLLYGMMITYKIIQFLPWFMKKKNFTIKEVILTCITIFVLRFMEFSISYAVSSFMLFGISILTILFFTFVHASLRLRNISNKVVNCLEGEKRTPMTILIYTSINCLAVLAKKITKNRKTKNQELTSTISHYIKL